jgi:hypothetical protein
VFGGFVIVGRGPTLCSNFRCADDVDASGAP